MVITPQTIKDKLHKQSRQIYSQIEIMKPSISLFDDIIEHPDFIRWSAASKPELHHYGKGGLITHVNEVIDLMFAVKKTLSLKTPDELIFLSALYHDVGKFQDYEPLDDVYENWRSTSHKYKIHHISRSAVEWVTNCRKYWNNPQVEDEVLHAILSHHGQKAWGSPVEPQSELAWLLHTCDHASARLNDWNKQ